MTDLTAKKLLDVMKNSEAKDKLEKAGDVHEAVSILGEYGVEITASELEDLAKKGNGEELSEENLDQVAGGAGWWKRVWGHIWDCLNGLVDGYNGD